MDPQQIWRCPDCDGTVELVSNDPYYPDKVFCPDCGEEMDRD